MIYGGKEVIGYGEGQGGFSFFYYGSGNDYKYGLKNTFVWGVKQHISIGKFSTGEEYIMRGDL